MISNKIEFYDKNTGDVIVDDRMYFVFVKGDGSVWRITPAKFYEEADTIISIDDFCQRCPDIQWKIAAEQ